MEETVNDHAIFKELQRYTPANNTLLRSIIEIKNDLLFIYSVSTGDILVTRTISLVFSGFTQRVQIFKPRRPIRGTVTLLRASENSENVALISNFGLYVVNLPHIKTCCMLPTSVPNEVKCSMWLVHPEGPKMHKMFLYQVLQVRWHPLNFDFLVVLFNDNYLRLVDTKAKMVITLLSLGRHPTHPVSTVNPLLENAVDFDFAPPKKVDDRTGSFLTLHPVILLRGNGEVLCAYLTKGQGTQKLLSIYPFDKKNHGLSACSITVLQSKPPIVVIASGNTQIMHCILLDTKNNMFLQVFEKFVIFKEIPWKRSSIHLILNKDNVANNRYYILHVGGMHAVMLPITAVLTKFMADTERELAIQKSEFMTQLKTVGSIVRYVLCTQVPGMTDLYPVYGTGFIGGRFASSKVIVLQANYIATSISLELLFPSSIQPATVTPGKKRKFSDIVSGYLRSSRASRPPVIKTRHFEIQLSLEESLEFLRGQMNCLKADKMKRHEFLAAVFEAKTQELAASFREQLEKLESLKAEKEELKRNAEIIAEKYEERNEKLLELNKRMEAVGLRLHLPVQRHVEAKMRTEVLEMKEKADVLKIALGQAQAKLESFEDQVMAGPSRRQRRPLYLNEHRKRLLRQQLSSMTRKIRANKDKAQDIEAQIESIENDPP